MARNTSVSLGDHFTSFIDEQVESGRYSSASDVIRAGLRMLERNEQEDAWLRAQIREAEIELAEGKVHEVTPDFWDALNREVAERVARGDQPDPNVFP
jgi:antitoxin ParD1/3/4